MLPFDDRDGTIWLDGKLCPWRDAKIHVCTHGLHYASSVFEGERLYSGRIFKSRAHSERLTASAAMLDMTLPYSIDQIEEAKYAAVKAQGFSDAYVRTFAWRGAEVMGISARAATIHMAVAVWEWPSYFSPQQRAEGLKLDIAKWRRPSPDTIPSAAKAAGLYMICTLSKHAAEENGCADAMMLDYRGFIAEATSANIFFIRDGAIHTPLPDCFLNGITRQTVIEIARAQGIVVHERHILPEELDTFSECFVTGTAAEIVPVGSIGQHKFLPSSMTDNLWQAYKQLTLQP